MRSSSRIACPADAFARLAERGTLERDRQFGPIAACDGVLISLRRETATAYTAENRVEDPRITKLRELLAQATKLLDSANELVVDLTAQLQRSANGDKEPEPVERGRKLRA